MPALLSLVDLALCSVPPREAQQQQQQRRAPATSSVNNFQRVRRFRRELVGRNGDPMYPKTVTSQALPRSKPAQPQLQTFSQLSVDRHRRKLSSSTLASALGGSTLRADQLTSRCDRPMSASPLLRVSPVGGRYAHLEGLCETRACARSEPGCRPTTAASAHYGYGSRTMSASSLMRPASVAGGSSAGRRESPHLGSRSATAAETVPLDSRDTSLLGAGFPGTRAKLDSWGSCLLERRY